ncbi:MAG: hypothetical protein QOH49_3087 [Acidobacteriota bacterium]|jgi:hypothetical protein|nr:hypothetical protein [Acidobacteriota bacterium]
MNPQVSSQATNADATAERETDQLNKENWIVERLPYTEDCPARGFLQLCADRRFHQLIQQEFKKDAQLSSREDYWIHADAGGTPKMAGQRVTPNYCYHQKDVRLMGWSAHGAGCGGFGEKVPDDVIMADLCKTMQTNVREYPLAKHFIYFVTVHKEQGNEQSVVYRMIAEPGSDIVCTQGTD